MIWLLFTILFLLQIADVYTTVKGLSSGKAKELNPLIKALMNEIGILPALLAFKIVYISLIIWLIVIDAPFILYGVIGVILLYSYIICNNVKVLNKINK